MNSSITDIQINNSPHFIQSTTINGFSVSFQIDSKQLDLYKEIQNNNVKMKKETYKIPKKTLEEWIDLLSKDGINSKELVKKKIEEVLRNG